MAASSSIRKPLGVRVTPEQHCVLKEAAAKQNRPVSSFVLTAALQAAQDLSPRPKKSRAEIDAIVRAAREAVQAANPAERDILEEFLAERRVEAARE
jgi:hypothetical protein